MSIKTTIEIPIGDQTARCTTEVALNATNTRAGKAQARDFDERLAYIASKTAADLVEAVKKTCNQPTLQVEAAARSDGSTKRVEAQLQPDRPVKRVKTNPVSETITVTVDSPRYESFDVRIGRRVALRHILELYAQKIEMPVDIFRLFFDGARVYAGLTAQELGLEDGGHIDVLMECKGS